MRINDADYADSFWKKLAEKWIFGCMSSQKITDCKIIRHDTWYGIWLLKMLTVFKKFAENTVSAAKCDYTHPTILSCMVLKKSVKNTDNVLGKFLDNQNTRTHFSEKLCSEKNMPKNRFCSIYEWNHFFYKKSFIKNVFGHF